MNINGKERLKLLEMWHAMKVVKFFILIEKNDDNDDTRKIFFKY